MYTLWQIILAILWRRRPAMAVEANLVGIIDKGLAMFEDEDSRCELQHSQAARSRISAALLDAHRKVDLLIHLRALEIAGLPWLGPNFQACRHPHHADRTLEALWRRFATLMLRFADAERIAHLRAVRLKREATQLPLRLRTACASTSPALRAEEESRVRSFVVQISSSSALRWGRWIARSCAQDGGGCAFARGPPFQLVPNSA